jgi:glycosyltransferase involved in cell wall biosynthesis
VQPLGRHAVTGERVQPPTGSATHVQHVPAVPERRVGPAQQLARQLSADLRVAAVGKRPRSALPGAARIALVDLREATAVLVSGVSMRVTFLTHYYPPEVGAPQTRISGLTRRLSSRGATVTVHTGFPHYPAGRVIAPYANRPWRRETEGDVQVFRSAIYPAPNQGVARRLANHASFAASALATAPLTGPADVIVVESPPLFVAGAGIGYARMKRAALVVHVADRWPASAVELGIVRRRRAISVAECLEDASYRAAAAITTPTVGLAEVLDDLPSGRGKVTRVAPAVDVDALPADPPRPAGPLRLLYAGTLGLAQGLETLVEAARLAGPDVACVTVAGDGAEGQALRELVARRKVSNVRFVGTVAAADIPALYRGADAAAVLLRGRPLFERALPTKLVEAMAAARPVILAARGEAQTVVEAAGAGIVVAPEDPAALARAVAELAQDHERVRALGEAGRRYAVDHFDWEVVIDTWERLLSRAAADGGVRT